jgi:hypothetical protein
MCMSNGDAGAGYEGKEGRYVWLLSSWFLQDEVWGDAIEDSEDDD